MDGVLETVNQLPLYDEGKARISFLVRQDKYHSPSEQYHTLKISTAGYIAKSGFIYIDSFE